MSLLNLDDFFEPDKSKIPSDYEKTLFFFLEKGVDYNTFMELPIPYIFSMLKTNSFYVEEERKRSKKK